MVNKALTNSGVRQVRQEVAETVALQVLAWLAADEDMLRNFCGATGAEPADLRRLAQDPEFLAGVLDFLTLDDSWVRAFSADAGIAPEIPAEARAALPGGAAPHWT